MSVNILEKYIPKRLDDIIGNKNAILRFKKWIKNKATNTLIVSGKNGIGKTLITKLILKKYNYNYKILLSNDIKEYKNNDTFKEYNNNFLNSMNIRVNNKMLINKNAFIFDDIESISLKKEKDYIMNIYKNNINTPIIFICNEGHNKIINELKKKNCDIIRFYSPSSIELFKFIKKIFINENIKIEDEECISDLINFSQYDIRRLLFLIQDYIYNYKKVTKQNINNFIKKSLEKNINLNLYESTLSVLNNTIDINNIYRLYKNEKVLLPLMIHENYYKKLLSNKKSVIDNFNNILNISDSISIGDKIETSIYTDQNWFLQNIHCFHTCIKPSIICSSYSKKLINSSIDFGADLNKTSLKNKNKKNITNLQNIIGPRTNDEILYLCRLSNYLCKNNKYDILINIIKEYLKNIELKDIDLFFKIDKTIDFLKMSLKDKKAIKELI
jgi:hypothetical protein